MLSQYAQDVLNADDDDAWRIFQLSRAEFGQSITTVAAAIGRILECTKNQYRLGATAGARLHDFKLANYPSISDVRLGEQLDAALRRLISIRNRAEHDEWSMTCGSSIHEVTGTGEQTVTLSTVESFVTVASIAAKCADALGAVATQASLQVMFGSALPPAAADSAAASVVAAVAPLHAERSDRWVWVERTTREYWLGEDLDGAP